MPSPSTSSLVPGTVSPLGAQNAGLSPDQAKMFGTGAQKRSSLKHAARQTNTGKIEQDPIKQAQAAGLTALAGIGKSYQALVNQNIANLQTKQGSLAVNEAALSSLFPNDEDKKEQFRKALQAYQTQPTEAGVKQLADIAGQEQINQGLTRFYQGAPEALAALQKTQDKVTIGQLDLAAAGTSLAQLAAALGKEEAFVSNLTPEELEAELDAIRAKNFSDIAALKAEASTATAQRREQIALELRALGESGTELAERTVEDLQQDVEKGRTVQFAGQERSIEELLGGEASEIIKDAASSESVLKELEKSEPQLAAWIKNNIAALKELETTMNRTTGDFVKTQQQYKEFLLPWAEGRQVLSHLLGEDLPDTLTMEDLTRFQQKLKTSSLGLFLSQTPSAVQLFEEDLSLIDRLKDRPPSYISNFLRTKEALENSPLLQAYFRMPADVNGKVYPDNFSQFGELQRVQKALSALGTAIENPETKIFLQAGIQGGTIRLTDLERMAADPKHLERLQFIDRQIKELETQTPGQLVDNLFGMPSDPDNLFNADVLTSFIEKAIETKDDQYHPKNKEAQQAWDKLVHYLSGDDGRLTREDLAPDALRKIAKDLANRGVLPEAKKELSQLVPLTRDPSGQMFGPRLSEGQIGVELSQEDKKKALKLNEGLPTAAKRVADSIINKRFYTENEKSIIVRELRNLYSPLPLANKLGIVRLLFPGDETLATELIKKARSLADTNKKAIKAKQDQAKRDAEYRDARALGDQLARDQLEKSPYGG